jgi:hypothetical protein
MCCQCLLSSLTLDFLKLITVDADAYHLPALIAADGQIPAGPLLLKLIISQAHVDSRATVSYIRKSLGELDVKMIDLSSNVEAFNFYVKAQVKALSARGETSNDLLMNLFKGYHAADDTAFKDLVTKKENDYEAGENLTTNSLMADMLVKYKARILVGKLSAPSKEQGQILALSAQLATMIAAKKSARTKDDPNDRKKKIKKDKNKWAWKDTLPGPGEATTKTFEGKCYHVNCQYHPNQWVCHETADCSKNPANAGAAPPATGTPPVASGTSSSRRLRQAQLAAALLEEGGESDEEDEDL